MQRAGAGTARTASRGTRCLRAAAWISGTPLGAGVGIYLLWMATGWEWLETAGLGTLGLGVLATVVAAVLLALGWVCALREGLPRARVHARAFLIAALLIGNYPAAALVVTSVVREKSCYTVTVRNAGATEWPGLVLEGGGIRHELGTLAPGAAMRCRLWFTTDGELLLRTSEPGHTEPMVVEGYVTTGMGNPNRGATLMRDATGCVQVIPHPCR